ncbi:unnamed protein product [Closterium sp. Yama58-4]|nr:unnamed protein product [Closterium sp. Yama58-4]
MAETARCAICAFSRNPFSPSRFPESNPSSVAQVRFLSPIQALIQVPVLTSMSKRASSIKIHHQLSAGRLPISRRRISTSSPSAALFSQQIDDPDFSLLPIARPELHQLGECFACAPPTSPRRQPLKGIITFFGGAFLGASPDVFYSYFLDLLAKGGYLVVAVPNPITFDHVAAAAGLHARATSALDLLQLHGLPSAGISAADVDGLPVYSVGHSNGALMQLLMGSLATTKRDRLPEANVIIAFNNRPASFAVPYFDQMGPAVQQLAPAIEAFPLTGIALSVAEQALEALQRSSIPLPPGVVRNDLDPLGRFLEQIPPVLGQVRDGVSEFTPPPAETRKLIASSYAVPRNLLIKFSVDTLDETDQLEPILTGRMEEIGGSLSTLLLEGSHATPLAPDVSWPVQDAFSPVDAIAQGVKSSALVDIRKLAQEVSAWLDDL